MFNPKDIILKARMIARVATYNESPFRIGPKVD